MTPKEWADKMCTFNMQWTDEVKRKFFSSLVLYRCNLEHKVEEVTKELGDRILNGQLPNNDIIIIDDELFRLMCKGKI